MSVSAWSESLTPSQLIGSATCYLNQARELPAAINDALCRGDKEEDYGQKMQEVATTLANAAAVIRLMNMDIPDGFWNVYNIIKDNPVCGIGTEATGAADLAREKWEADARAKGLYGDKALCPAGQVWDCRPNNLRLMRRVPTTWTCGCFPINDQEYG
ncbi:MAG: hypothetical protein GYA26_10885 [Flexilinea flocculi]|nr:hypothetical protein [Flexilinea flocculi]